MLTGLGLVVALFFAANIGASGTAAAMGECYGGGAIRSKRLAMVLVGVFAFLGAVIGGHTVVKTISSGIVPQELVGIEQALIVLGSSCLTLFLANLLGIPLSTSEVTVGAVVGVGLAFQSVFYDRLAFIVSTWILLPVVSFTLMAILGKIAVRPLDAKVVRLRSGTHLLRGLAALLIVSGCYEAFSAGMNNVANAVGPLVSAGVIDPSQGVLYGGLALALGALLLGGNVLETNGKRITKMSLIGGTLVSFTGATLVVIASLFGIPVPLTQATTCGIMGLGYAHAGASVFQKATVRTILRIWLISPVLSLVLTYCLSTALDPTATFLQPMTAVVVALGLPIAFLLGRTLAREAQERLPVSAVEYRPARAQRG